MTTCVSDWCSGCVGTTAGSATYCPFTEASRQRLATRYLAIGAPCPYWKSSSTGTTRAGAPA